MTFCPEHPKRDQNPKFTPLSETTSILVHSTWGPPPRDSEPDFRIWAYDTLEVLQQPFGNQLCKMCTQKGLRLIE